MIALTNSYAYTTHPGMATYAWEDDYESTTLDQHNDSVIMAQQPADRPLNNRIFTLLGEYCQLPDNWDEEGALAPSSNAIQQAFYVTAIMEQSGQPIFHTAPGPYGEIMMDLRNEVADKSIELIFYPERSVYVTFGAGEEPKQAPYNEEMLAGILEWLNQPVHG